MNVQTCRVDGGKQLPKNVGAALGVLVEDERGTSQLGESGKTAGPGRWFEHDVGGRDRGRATCNVSKPNRCGELLKRFGSDRRVWAGRRLVILASFGSMAAGEAALTRMAAPCA